MKRSRVVFFLLGIVWLGCFIWYGWLFRPEIRPLTFWAFNVGQGDAFLVETPSRRQLLIDAGPGTKVLEQLGKAMPMFDRNIDVAVLTNPDKDHMEGFLDVVKRYRIGRFVMTGVERKEESVLYNRLRELIAEKHVPVQYIKTGDRFLFDDGIALTVLSPEQNLRNTIKNSINDTSIVARLDFFRFSLLLTGDATGDAEKRLVKIQKNVRADVLKVSHHGSKYSSTSEFLDAVQPRMAIISVGKRNPYGHPHAETLERLGVRGIEVLQTVDEDVCLQSQGLDERIAAC